MPENIPPFPCRGISIEGRPALSPQNAETVTVTHSEDGTPQYHCVYLRGRYCSADPEATQSTAPWCYRLPENNSPLNTVDHFKADQPTQEDRLAEFGRRVGKALGEKGMSVRKLASLIDVSPAYISIIVHGKNPTTDRPAQISSLVATRLCEALGFEGEEMLNLAGYTRISARNAFSS